MPWAAYSAGKAGRGGTIGGAIGGGEVEGGEADVGFSGGTPGGEWRGASNGLIGGGASKETPIGRGAGGAYPVHAAGGGGA